MVIGAEFPSPLSLPLSFSSLFLYISLFILGLSSICHGRPTFLESSAQNFIGIDIALHRQGARETQMGKRRSGAGFPNISNNRFLLTYRVPSFINRVIVESTKTRTSSVLSLSLFFSRSANYRHRTKYANPTPV